MLQETNALKIIQTVLSEEKIIKQYVQNNLIFILKQRQTTNFFFKNTQSKGTH